MLKPVEHGVQLSAKLLNGLALAVPWLTRGGTGANYLVTALP